VFLALISLPLLYWLKRLRIPNVLAVLLTMLAVIALLAGIGLLAGGSVNRFTDAAPLYQARLEQMSQGVREWIGNRGIDVSTLLSSQQVSPRAVMDLTRNLLRSIAVVLSQTVTVLLTMTFILLEAAGFPAKMKAAFGGADGGLERFAKVRQEIQRYLVIKTLVSLATGVLIGGWLAILGVDFPLLWGLLAFLLNYIPTLGSLIAAVPAVLLTVVQLGPGRAAAAALGYVVVNVALGNLVEPHLMGRRLGLSTLVIFLSLVFWGWVWGPVGMLLSVPLTTIVKILLENSEDFRWLAALLDSTPKSRA
jgi:AI-2 transport protein TqsA